MKVLGDKILVEVASNETVTTGGIIIPDSAGQERKYEGRVIDVGNNPDIKKYGVEVGAYVFYPKGLNTEFKVANDDKIYDIVSIYDILAVGEEE